MAGNSLTNRETISSSQTSFICPFVGQDIWKHLHCSKPRQRFLGVCSYQLLGIIESRLDSENVPTFILNGQVSDLNWRVPTWP